MSEKLNIHPGIKNIEKEMVAIRRDFHQYPELGFDVHRTAGIVAEKLESYGITVQTGIGKTGVIGDLQGDNPGPTIALRADMDALPLQETGDVPYKSIHDGKMHACGHDGHMAMLLGAAKVIAENKSGLEGKIRFIFQPAEEGEGGARYMIQDGCLEGVDAIYGIHLWNYQALGTVGVKSGPILASADIFSITIKGIGGHGATPQGTVDCVVVAGQLINAIQTIVSRNTNPLESTVVTLGKIQGGDNFNIIADSLTLNGTARAFTEENRQMIKKRLKEICAGVGQTNNATIMLDYEDGYPPTVNHDLPSKKVLAVAKKVVGDGAELPYMSMGGEDFAYYLQKIPGCFFFVGSAPSDGEPRSVPHHCSHFDIDERSLLVGASIFIELALGNEG